MYFYPITPEKKEWLAKKAEAQKKIQEENTQPASEDQTKPVVPTDAPVPTEAMICETFD